jgi:heptosyltransferase II
MDDHSAVLPRAGVKKILLLQQRQIGDVILATPLIEMLAKGFPEAEIHFFTEKKCAPVLQGNPGLARTWVLDRGKHTSLYKQFRFYREIARQGFDIVVDLQQLPRCRTITLLSRSPVRLTATPPWYNRMFYTHWADRTPGYAVGTKASVLAPLGITWKGELPRIHLDAEEREWARHWLLEKGMVEGDLIVTIDATHKSSTRRWPGEHFSRLIKEAARHWQNMHFIMLYGPGEREEVRQVALHSGSERCIVPPRDLTLRESAAIMERADLHVGNCSAPRHMATALSTPSLVIMGSNTPISWTCPTGPHRVVVHDIECRPCNRGECDHLRCLREITPVRVLEEMQGMLKTERRLPR